MRVAFTLLDIVGRLPVAVEDKLVPQCPTGKVGYRRKADARAEVSRINRELHHTMHPFRCGYCEQYHLGHSRGRA